MSNGLPEFTFDLGELPGAEQTPKQEEDTQVQEPENKEEPKEETPEPQEPEIKQDLDFDKKIQQKLNEEPEDDSTEEPSIGDDRLMSLYSFYKEEGLLNHDGEFKGTKEEFAEILKQERVAQQEAFENELVNAMPEYAQNLVEYILTEGDKLSVDKLQEFLGVTSQAASIPEVESEDQARDYLLKKYTKLHGNETVAQKFVEALEDDGKLVEVGKAEADKDKEEALELEKVKVQESKAQKAARLQAQQQFQNTLVEELKQTGWKPDVQQEVYHEIFSQGLRAKTSGIVQHPKALLKLANYLRYYDPASGDIDEKKFADTTFSGAAKNLRDSIERNFGKSGAFGGNRIESTKKVDDKNVQYEFVE